MTTNPLFSIITITRNNLGGLKKTGQSLNEQTNRDFEWVIVDGKSDDGTRDYLTTVKAKIISEPDKGIYDAMNKGINTSSGDYLIFMNAGDYFFNSDTLNTVADKTSQDHPEFIYGDAMELSNGEQRYKKSRPASKINQGMFTHHQAMIYNKTILENKKYDLSYDIAADYDLTLSVLRDNPETLYIPLPLCIFEGKGVSQQRVLQGRKEQFIIRRKHGLSSVQNILTFLAQTCLYRFRVLFPDFYWRLKRG